MLQLQTEQAHARILALMANIGELEKRFAGIEAEFAAQQAPLSATKGAQDSALSALRAAIDGIKALNYGVLSENQGAIIRRLDEMGAQMDVSLRQLQSGLADAKALVAERDQKFDASEETRAELEKKSDAKIEELKAGLDRYSGEMSGYKAEMRSMIDALATKFAAVTSFNLRGEWVSGAVYSRGDVVILNGSSWASTVDGNTQKPGKKAKGWQLLAARGVSGGGISTPGAKGDQGPAGADGADGADGLAGPAGPAGADGAGTETVFLSTGNTIRVTNGAIYTPLNAISVNLEADSFYSFKFRIGLFLSAKELKDIYFTFDGSTADVDFIERTTTAWEIGDGQIDSEANNAVADISTMYFPDPKATESIVEISGHVKTSLFGDGTFRPQVRIVQATVPKYADIISRSSILTKLNLV